MLHRTVWLASVMAAGGLFAAVMTGAAHAEATSKNISNVAQPTIIIEKEGECVEPVDVMRRDHMKFILHQRDKTMHLGIRTEKHSLTKCVNCHANSKTNSVIGKDGFCSSCHSYTAVSIDCFGCHTASGEKSAASRDEGMDGVMPPGHLDKMVTTIPAIQQEPASTGKAP